MSAQTSGAAGNGSTLVCLWNGRQVELDRALSQARDLRAEATAEMLRTVGRAVALLLSTVVDVLRFERDRRAFTIRWRAMNDRQLADLGIGRADIDQQAVRAALGLTGAVPVKPQLATVRAASARPANEDLARAHADAA